MQFFLIPLRTIAICYAGDRIARFRNALSCHEAALPFTKTRWSAVALCLLLAAGMAHAGDFVSIGKPSAILYAEPDLHAKKLFVVNQYMPFERIITLRDWVQVRDHSGGLYWVQKRMLSNRKYVYTLRSVVDVHAAPSMTSPLMFRVGLHVAMEWLESTGKGWVKVRHRDGESGYVRDNDVWGA
jgi:SH3-like domain-containing protein